MAITRQTIIATLQARLEQNPKILAMWLEGADATNTVDEFSDIDLCCSVEAGAIAEVTAEARQALETLGTIDLAQVLVAGEDNQHIVFHLAGTSEYLLLDFCLYVARGSDFIEADEIEQPLIIFDRCSIIRYSSAEESREWKNRNERLSELKSTVAQSARIEKYVRRGAFLEAFGYYHKWLLTPLVEVLRMQYTPLHPDYYIVHISRHLPGDILMRLEGLFKVSSVAEIQRKSKEAQAFFKEVTTQLQGY